MTFGHVFVLLFSLFVAFNIYKTVAFLRRAQPHVGHVITLNDVGMEDAFYSATVQFDLGAEGSHKVDVDVGGNFFNSVKVGDEVEILFDPLKNEGSLYTTRHVFCNSIICLFIWVLLIFVFVMKSS
jgi:hypothetical protein